MRPPLLEKVETKAQLRYVQHSPSILSVQLQINAHSFTLISEYAPVLGWEKNPNSEARDAFWAAMDEAAATAPKASALVVLADLNSSVGRTKAQADGHNSNGDAAKYAVTGPHGIGRENAGERELRAFCAEAGLRVMNT